MEHEVMSGTCARTVLLWDTPNMDMALGEVIGAQPSRETRPQFAAIAQWLCGFAPAGVPVEATAFVNVPDDPSTDQQAWITMLLHNGWSVHAQPKRCAGDDVDDAMLAYLDDRVGALDRVVVASHDGRAFLDPLRGLAADGVEVTVLGFVEQAAWPQRSEGIGFVDLEDVPGAFTVTLPRLRALPDTGRVLVPKAALVGEAA